MTAAGFSALFGGEVLQSEIDLAATELVRGSIWQGATDNLAHNYNLYCAHEVFKPLGLPDSQFISAWGLLVNALSAAHSNNPDTEAKTALTRIGLHRTSFPLDDPGAWVVGIAWRTAKGSLTPEQAAKFDSAFFGERIPWLHANTRKQLHARGELISAELHDLVFRRRQQNQQIHWIWTPEGKTFE